MYSLRWQLFWWIWQDFVLLALLFWVEQRTDLCANMCTGSQDHLVSLLPPNHFPRGVIDGSFTRAISPKIHLFLLSSSKLLEQFQTSLSAAFYERCLHSEPAFFLCLVGFWTKLLAKIVKLAEHCRDCVCFFPCRRTEALWFPNLVDMKQTKLTFRLKRTWLCSRGSLSSKVQKKNIQKSIKTWIRNEVAASVDSV